MGKHICLALLVYNNIDVQSHDPVYDSYIANKDTIIGELMNNKELLCDLDKDSSGSDSDPSEDNLPPSELENIVKIQSAPKLEKEKKQSKEIDIKNKSDNNKKREHSIKALPIPRKGKCNLCGEVLTLGHSCTYKAKGLIKLSISTRSASLAYINTNGKKVKDQATQTIKIEESKTLSPHESLKINKTKVSKSFQSSARPMIPEDISSFGRLWKSKQLPSLKKK
jgi:ribosomal protein L32